MRNVAILGGGIGGLTAALCFAAKGATVTVYEQASALTEVGAGLQLTPNGMRVLDALGLADDIAGHSIAANAVVPTDGLTGKQVTRFDLSHKSPRYRFTHRADLIACLASACRKAGVTVSLNCRIEAVNLEGVFQVDGADVSPDLTVGADGLHSIVRPVLNGAAEPFFTKQVAWRAIIETEASAEARIWMLPGAHVVTYPLRDGRLNIVAVREQDTWVDDGWTHPDDPSNLRVAFAAACPALQNILSDVAQTNLWGLFRHPVAESWGNGRLAILGDAAHPTLPFLAQGANLAIEDAFVLAACCSAGPLADGLARYQTLRHARVTRAINTANANAVNYHLSGVRRSASHMVLKGIGALAPDAFINRLSWLYDHDVTASFG